ncbi:hypothetical protein ACMXZC_00990, partial [Pasteurella multocida]
RLIFDTHILNGKLSLFRVNCQIKSDLLQFISDFGKLLVVEYIDDELPAVHWHNSNGSFYADCESALDIV